MTLDEYIGLLLNLREEHGGKIEVDTTGAMYDRTAAPRPSVAHRKILKGRESKPTFFSDGYEAEDRRGQLVIKV